MASRHWCFTWNTHTAEDVDKQALMEHCIYAIYQTEIGVEGGREHVQGFFSLRGHNGWTLRTIRDRFFAVLGGAHFEQARDVQASIAYCSKVGEGGRVPGSECVEIGDKPQVGRPSTKKNLELAVRLMQEVGGPENLAKEDPVLYARFHRNLEAVWQVIRPRMDMSGFAAREWQQKVLDEVDQDPDPRKINWYVDVVGGKGKSYLSRYLVCEKDAFYTQGGKHSDILYGYKEQRVVVFDLCRDVEGYVPYSVMETCKNGIMFKAKYNSQMVTFPVPHVFVFANFEPDLSKLSADRWNVVRL